jgi:ribosome recycling factor
VAARNVAGTPSWTADFEQEKMISEDDLKKGEEDLQKLTDKYIEVINAVGERKQKEILEV